MLPAMVKSSFVAVPAVPSTSIQGLGKGQADSGVAINLGNLTIALNVNFNKDFLAKAVRILGGKRHDFASTKHPNPSCCR